jgi:hypothetical protein
MASLRPASYFFTGRRDERLQIKHEDILVNPPMRYDDGWRMSIQFSF